MIPATIEQEQVVFEAALPQLLIDHNGEFVLQKSGNVVATFSDFTSAYEVGMRKYGLEGVFLVARVEECRPQVISYAWVNGVMFGES